MIQKLKLIFFCKYMLFFNFSNSRSRLCLFQDTALGSCKSYRYNIHSIKSKVFSIVSMGLFHDTFYSHCLAIVLPAHLLNWQ